MRLRGRSPSNSVDCDVLPPRVVVFVQGFYSEIHSLIGDPSVIQKALEGVEFRTARDPTRGHEIANGVWYTVMHLPPIGRSVAIYYTFDDERVYFHRAIERPFNPDKMIL